MSSCDVMLELAEAVDQGRPQVVGIKCHDKENSRLSCNSKKLELKAFTPACAKRTSGCHCRLLTGYCVCMSHSPSRQTVCTQWQDHLGSTVSPPFNCSQRRLPAHHAGKTSHAGQSSRIFGRVVRDPLDMGPELSFVVNNLLHGEGSCVSWG